MISVGPVTNNIGNEFRINVNYGNVMYMDSFAEFYTRNHFNNTTEQLNSLAMFCVAFRKAIITEIGLLDEQFRLGSFEDDDFSQRIRQSGYKLLCTEDVFVHHIGNASFSKLGGGKYDSLMKENRAKFEKKWNRSAEFHKYREGVSGSPPEIKH